MISPSARCKWEGVKPKGSSRRLWALDSRASVFEQAHAAGMADLDDAALLQLLRGARS
jgi:hypothetical protein